MQCCVRVVLAWPPSGRSSSLRWILEQPLITHPAHIHRAGPRVTAHGVNDRLRSCRVEPGLPGKATGYYRVRFANGRAIHEKHRTPVLLSAPSAVAFSLDPDRMSGPVLSNGIEAGHERDEDGPSSRSRVTPIEAHTVVETDELSHRQLGDDDRDHHTLPFSLRIAIPGPSWLLVPACRDFSRNAAEDAGSRCQIRVRNHFSVGAGNGADRTADPVGRSRYPGTWMTDDTIGVAIQR